LEVISGRGWGFLFGGLAFGCSSLQKERQIDGEGRALILRRDGGNGATHHFDETLDDGKA
jgi:hypothetical protein